MATKLGFGTYIAGNSPVHATNAQVKIILACAFSIAAFVVGTWTALAVLFAVAVVLYALARVPLSSALAGLGPVAFILAFTVVAHMFAFADAQAVAQAGTGPAGLPRYILIAGGIAVTLEGLARGIFVALRIALLVAACSLLTFTTPVMELVDGMAKLASPLRKLRVPVEDVAMTVSIALRFIPTTVAEAQSLIKAQRARCADFDSASPLSRARAWIPVFIPLFVRLFRRADELAVAMDARGYHGEGRSSMRDMRLRGVDLGIMACGVAGLVVLCAFL